MKKHFVTILIMALNLCAFTELQAQSRVRSFPDSIRIEFPDHQAIIIFEMKHFLEDKATMQTFPAAFQDLLNQAKKALPTNISELPPQRMTFNFKKGNDHLITTTSNGHSFQDIEDQWLVTIEDLIPAKTKLKIQPSAVKELLPPGWEVLIFAPDYRVTIYGENLASLEAVATESLDAVVEKISNDPSMKKIGKQSIISKMIIQKKEIVSSSIGFIFPGDFVGLHPGGSVAVLNNTIYPELFLKTAFYFSNRFGASRQRLEITYDLSFFTIPKEGGFGSHNNSFLSASYSRSFRKGDERPRWFGVGAGYLIHNGGYPFKGKTGKIFFETDLGSSKLTLIPELYLTDDFKKAQFGMKLNYKF
jgi:hypothetical protein